jgi:hypothetical protein
MGIKWIITGNIQEFIERNKMKAIVLIYIIINSPIIIYLMICAGYAIFYMIENYDIDDDIF